MQDKDAISLTIAGHLHHDWTRASIDSDLFTPADAWQVGLGIPAAQIPEWVRPWAPVEVRIGDALVLSGRIDAIRRTIRKDALDLTLSGRDGAAVLLDCSAPVKTRRDVTVEEVCALIVRPLGIDRIDVQQGGPPRKKVSVEPGMTAWEALTRAAEASGLWPWFTPDGVLKVAAPDYSRPADAELLCAFDGTKNNVLSVEYETDISRRYSEVTVLGQSVGNEDDEAQNAISGRAWDALAWFQRPLIRDEGHVDSIAEAKTRAKKILSDSVFEYRTITVEVRGHRTDSGDLWEPGMHIRLRVEGLCETDNLLARRTLRAGREGRTTTLTLKPWGLWLPDTSKKPKKKKKRGKHDDDEWGLD